jgi:DNA-binding transcriptional ArsR family regulator
LTGDTPTTPDRGGRSGEAFKFNWLKQVSRTQGLTATQLYAATEAFNKADEYGRAIFLGYESLAATTGMGKTSARLALKSLVDLGLIRRTARGGRSGDGRKWASAYELTFSTDSTLTVDPVEQSGSTVSGLPVESDVNRQSSVPQPSDPHVSTVSGLLPNKPAPINPLPINPPPLSPCVSNAGAGARETDSIAQEVERIFGNVVEGEVVEGDAIAFSDLFSFDGRPTSIYEERRPDPPSRTEPEQREPAPEPYPAEYAALISNSTSAMLRSTWAYDEALALLADYAGSGLAQNSSEFRKYLTAKQKRAA